MRYKLLTLFAGLLLAGVILNSCRQGSTLTDTMPMRTGSGGGTTAANPVVVYTKNGGAAIGVMDADCSHRTVVYTGANGATVNTPSWSPGSSIAFRLGSGTKTYIMAEDVSVNSSGIPVGSNLRTIDSSSWYADSLQIQWPSWSSTSSIDQIAYGLYGAHNYYVCRISASGGARNIVYTSPVNIYPYSVAWSPDDSKIAVALGDRNNSAWGAIIVISASTNTVTDSISLASVAGSIDWSRTGTTNKLLYSISGGDLYYLTPSSGSSPTAAGLFYSGSSFQEPHEGTWSPNNGSILYTAAGLDNKTHSEVSQIRKVVAFQGYQHSSVLYSAYYLSDSTIFGVKWHR